MSEGAGQHRLVFGLSADPIHVGHVEMVAQSATALIALGYCLTEVLLIPVYRRNPVGVRKDRLPQTYPQRLEMCRLAAAEVAERLFRRDVGVRACTIEADLARESELPNYTADTLSALRAEGRPASSSSSAASLSPAPTRSSVGGTAPTTSWRWQLWRSVHGWATFPTRPTWPLWRLKGRISWC